MCRGHSGAHGGGADLFWITGFVVFHVGEVVAKCRNPSFGHPLRDLTEGCVAHVRACTVTEDQQMSGPGGTDQKGGNLSFIRCCDKRHLFSFINHEASRSTNMAKQAVLTTPRVQKCMPRPVAALRWLQRERRAPLDSKPLGHDGHKSNVKRFALDLRYP